MRGLRFDKLTRDEAITPEKKFPIPLTSNPKRPTHLGVKNGRLAFFWSDIGPVNYRSRGHWHFWWIPPWAEIYRFLIFERTPAGWNYGRGPVWE
jgi:hypothetical protein